MNEISQEYNIDTINNMSKGLLIEENQKLKYEIEQLKQKLQEREQETFNEKDIIDDMM